MSSTSGGLRNAIYRACEEGQELHLFQQPLHCVFSVKSNVLVAFPEVVASHRQLEWLYGLLGEHLLSISALASS